MKNYYVYILANKTNTTIYIGVTNNLERRLYEHRAKIDKNGFAERYNTDKIVYYEMTSDVTSAITREKELKGWKRCKKNELISDFNPDWKNLF